MFPLFSTGRCHSVRTYHPTPNFIVLTSRTIIGGSSRNARLYARRVYQRSVGKHGGSTAAGAATGSRAKRGGVERGRCVLYHRSDHPYPGERFSSGRIVFRENAGRERCEGEIFSGSRRGTVPLRARFSAQSSVGSAGGVSREGEIEAGSKFLRSAWIGTCHSGERQVFRFPDLFREESIRTHNCRLSRKLCIRSRGSGGCKVSEAVEDPCMRSCDPL